MQETSVTMSNGVCERSLRVAGFSLMESTYPARARISPHAHAHAKISFIIAGGTSETTRRVEHRCAAGSAVLKPANADHSNVFSPVGMRTLIAYRDEEEDEQFRHWHESLDRYQWIHGGPVVRLMFAVFRLFRQAQPGHTEAVEEALYDLTEAIQSDSQERKAGAVPRWLDAVRDYIHDHYTGGIEVRSLANMVGTHPVYLARVFRRSQGCSITKYVQRLRTRHATSLLSNTEAPIARVALASGFADHAHLCRVFKTEMGTTPGLYRQIVNN